MKHKAQHAANHCGLSPCTAGKMKRYVGSGFLECLVRRLQEAAKTVGGSYRQF